MNTTITPETLNQVLIDLSASKLPSEEFLIQILTSARELITNEPNLVKITNNVSIIGKISGQFYDLNEALKYTGLPSQSNHLIFLGGIVNRGYHSVECLIKIAVLKLLHPNQVTILRGTSENAQICKVYQFETEVEKKFGNTNVGFTAYAMFDVLPISAIVNEKIFCVFGGLSPDVKTIADIEKINRMGEINDEGPMTDLIWSDPCEEMIDDFAQSNRGTGKLYGKKAVDDFLKNNGLSLIVRSLQLADEGFKFQFDSRVLTIFSAPNYCYRCGNKAAVVKFDINLNQSISVFTESEESTQFYKALSEKNKK